VKNILCFGDSNTFGLKPDGSGRFDFPVRYPGILQTALGSDYHIIEEGCPGRTTIFEDRRRPHKRGIDYITPCLESHTPLDYVIVMLGTNDCKTAFGASCRDIAAGMAAIIARIQHGTAPVPGILLVSPIHLGDDISKPGYDPEFDQVSVKVSAELAAEYRRLARETGCGFLDAAAVAQPSPIDQEHLDDAGHRNLARAAAAFIAGNEL